MSNHPNNIISFNDNDVEKCIYYLLGESEYFLPWFKDCMLVFGHLFYKNKQVISHKQINKVLMEIYKNPLLTGGRNIFYNYCNEYFVGIFRHNVQIFLDNIESYQLRKKVPKHRVIKPIISDGINHHFQMDLIDMQKYAKSNFRYQYCLNIIDVFSKFLYSIPIKDKSAELIAIELDKLFSNPNNRPIKLQSDNRLEFLNQLVKNVCKKYGINQIFSLQYIPQQNGCIERINGT
jgi:hypothetical protein